MERREIPVNDLRLDPINPRLPAEIQGADQVVLLEYLHERGVLDELIRSFDDNDFFEHEPLIAFEDPAVGMVVLEGNRRLSALKIFVGSPEAEELELEPGLDDKPSPAKVKKLSIVPVYVVADRDEVHQYLGFRHIGGIKTWPAEAKARYLQAEVQRSLDSGAPKPFLDVARRVGSNSQGVRNSFTAITVLHHARDEYGIDVAWVLHKRFGVWLRCMTSDIRSYIGLRAAREYEDVVAAIAKVDEERLREVLDDLAPRGDRRAVLADSRDVTVYGQVLMSTEAHDVLRRYDDLQVARQIVESATLPARVLDLRDRVDVAREEAQRVDFSSDLWDAVTALAASARSLRGTVRELQEDALDEID